MSRFIIDIDGVISKKLGWSFEDSYERNKEMFLNIEADKKIINKINQLHKRGHTIILNTSRLWHDYDVTIKWLKKHKVKYHQLIMAKPLGDYYIDDKNKSIEEFLRM